jgi:hypothetical protein
MYEQVRAAIEESNGVLRLEPALVARDWLPPGRRLGLPNADYDLGERGFVCERWLGSTTHADNRVGPDDEGISYIRTSTGRLSLKDVVDVVPELIMGTEYAASHEGLGRLAKIFDYGARIPYHIHPPTDQAALVGRNSKDEAYYFPPGVDLGAHPETFYGVHPWLAEGDNGEVLLKYLEEWKDDAILQHAFAYMQVPEEGFLIDSGILHAPGTALTIELQEDADTMAMFQALNAGKIISKEMLYKDVTPEDRERLKERALLRWIDWEANADPRFYENRVLRPQVFRREDGADEAWLFYGTPKFSGKRIRVAPGARITDVENGVYNLLVWQGEGTIAGHDVRGGVVGEDELMLVHSAATSAHEIVNTGTTELLLVKFFGPDINHDVPAAGIGAGRDF